MKRWIPTLLLATGALLILAGPALSSVPKVVLIEKHGATW
jgi:hypothetical protein